MEFLSRNPDIVQVHNAFTYAEVADMSDWSNDPSIISRMEQKLEAITGIQATGHAWELRKKLLTLSDEDFGELRGKSSSFWE